MTIDKFLATILRCLQPVQACGFDALRRLGDRKQGVGRGLFSHFHIMSNRLSVGIYDTIPCI